MGRPVDPSCQEHYALFETPIGDCGVAWSGQGLTRLQLPESDRGATGRRLGVSEAEPPAEVTRAIAEVRRYLGGAEVDFSSVALDLARVSPFHRKVYDAARSVESSISGRVLPSKLTTRIGASCLSFLAVASLTYQRSLLR